MATVTETRALVHALTPLQLAAWYGLMVTDGELTEAFARALPPEEFAELIAHRQLWAIVTDDPAAAPEAIVWAQPWLQGAKVSIWLHPQLRRTRGGGERIQDLMEAALATYPVLIALATDVRIQSLHLRYGFRGITIPGFGPQGRPVWLGWVSAQTWRPQLPGGTSDA